MRFVNRNLLHEYTIYTEIRAQSSGSGVSVEDAEGGDERDGNSAARTEFKMPLFDERNTDLRHTVADLR